MLRGSTSVRSAGSHSSLRQHTLDSAQIIANLLSGESPESTTKQGFVSGALETMSATNTVKNDFVVTAVLRNINSINVGKQQVYDLEVEGEHEYFVNGVLVSNCIDAARYLATAKLSFQRKNKRGIRRRN